MDRIELAERRYKAIVREPLPDRWQLPHRELEAWLLNDVCSVVADYAKRPRFREQAAWPLEKLRVGTDSAERQLLDPFDHALVKCAKALTKLAANAPIASVLKEICPPTEAIVREVIRITGGNSRRVGAEKGTVNTLAIEASQVRAIAERFWTDLVCQDDYFEPRGGWMRKSPEGRGQAGEFIVSLNPELLPVGNLVVRTMLRRVEILFSLVDSFRNKCLAAIARATRRYPAQLKAQNDAWESLEVAYRSLQEGMRDAPAAQICESCIIMTQVYAAFAQSPNLQWLNLPEESIRTGAQGLRFRLTHSKGLEIVERIAAALGDLRGLYAGARPNLSAIEEAVASGGLVVVQVPREAYWAGDRIDADWHGSDTSWKLLVALAKKAVTESQVGEADLFENVVSRSAMSTVYGRLKKLLPASLWKHILPGNEPRTYRMDLQGKRAYLF
jgi:hypothetical protein